jgi:hypothetical protein
MQIVVILYHLKMVREMCVYFLYSWHFADATCFEYFQSLVGCFCTYRTHGQQGLRGNEENET